MEFAHEKDWDLHKNKHKVKVHDDAVGRVTHSLTSVFFAGRNGLLGKITRCKSENHVPIVAVSEEPHISDVHSRRATDCESQVSKHPETGREVFLNQMS